MPEEPVIELNDGKTATQDLSGFMERLMTYIVKSIYDTSIVDDEEINPCRTDLPMCTFEQHKTVPNGEDLILSEHDSFTQWVCTLSPWRQCDTPLLIRRLSQIDWISLYEVSHQHHQLTQIFEEMTSAPRQDSFT